jgi:hypothetical protein
MPHKLIKAIGIFAVVLCFAGFAMSALVALRSGKLFIGGNVYHLAVPTLLVLIILGVAALVIVIKAGQRALVMIRAWRASRNFG